MCNYIYVHNYSLTTFLYADVIFLRSVGVMLSVKVHAYFHVNYYFTPPPEHFIMISLLIVGIIYVLHITEVPIVATCNDCYYAYIACSDAVALVEYSHK